MAADLNDWIQIQYDSNVVQQNAQPSVVLDVASPFTMNSLTVEVPRSLNTTIGGGTVLHDGTTDGSKVTMYSYLYNNKETLDEAETEDAYVNAIDAKNFQFLNKLHVAYDNSCLGVTGGRSATASDNRPFDSLLQVLKTTDTELGYTANDNVLTGALTYDNLSALLGLLEDSDWGDQSQLVVMAHRGLRQSMRAIKDDNNDPIFQSADAVVHADTVFGIPISWTTGAVETTSYSQAIGSRSANPRLFFVANRNVIVAGRRIDPQARFIPAAINTTDLEHTLQHRARYGWCATAAAGAAVLRVNS